MKKNDTEQNEQDKLDVKMQLWKEIEPILATLDEDQLDRLMAKGFDDIQGFMEMLKNETDLRLVRMREEIDSKRKELAELHDEVKAKDLRIQELETENKRRKQELKTSEKCLHEALMKKLRI